MNCFWEGFEKEAAKEEALARVALIDTVNQTLLMGKRRDNKRWTITSGHLDPGEKPIDAAIREVREEAGITVTKDQLKSIGKNIGKKKDGTPITVHGFYVPFSGNVPSAHNGEDPDEEISQWRWESLANGLPKDVGENLHIPLKKDKVVQFAMKKLTEQVMEKAAFGRYLRVRQGDAQALFPALTSKIFTEGPQQYAQNYDKIQTYREEKKKRKKMKSIA